MTNSDRPPVPSWLGIVLKCDRAGSAWFVGTGFFLAPLLAVVSPWPTLTVVIWVLVGLAGLWLGLLGVAMATGLAMVMRSNIEIPEDYWRSIVNY
ncbi:hypothetical protein [Mycolicibacterium helvum]|uniref:hypothetical protein n=1 Tax=Mycolicibacterium helvum TaxID=1534349 RepID=UPI0013D8C539|nr:hypothetical protein [Mycolicibacterium helvum]